MSDEPIKCIETINEEAKNAGMQLSFPQIVDAPQGQKQNYEYGFFDHVFVVQQHDSYLGSFSGSVYYPFMGKYLKVDFCM